MSGRQRVEGMIRQKEQDLQELSEKMQAVRSYLDALHDVLKVLPREKAPGSAEGLLRAGSAVAEARKAIRSEGRPLHVDELLRAMNKPLTRESRSSLAGSIAAYVRRQEIFTRPAPNTFGLIELERERTDADDEPTNGVSASDGPPDDFGSDHPDRRLLHGNLN